MPSLDYTSVLNVLTVEKLFDDGLADLNFIKPGSRHQVLVLIEPMHHQVIVNCVNVSELRVFFVRLR